MTGNLRRKSGGDREITGAGEDQEAREMGKSAWLTTSLSYLTI